MSEPFGLPSDSMGNFLLSKQIPNRTDKITPYEAYWGWLYGIHYGEQIYTDGRMVNAMQQQEAIQRNNTSICDQLTDCCKKESNDCCNSPESLNNMSHPNYHFKPNSANEWRYKEFKAPPEEFFTFPQHLHYDTSNDIVFMRAAMGSFRYSWQVQSVDCSTTPKTATIGYKAFNRVGTKSGSRLPVSRVPYLNKLRWFKKDWHWLPENALGIENLDQVFIWQQTIKCE